MSEADDTTGSGGADPWDPSVTLGDGPTSFNLIGEMIGHYRITQEIGRGGQGVVYAAEDEKLHRKVALKILSRAAALSRSARRRFYREATAAAGLDHAGICSILEVGEHEGVPFIVMPFLTGHNLRHMIRLSQSHMDLSMDTIPSRDNEEPQLPVNQGSAISDEARLPDRELIRSTCILFEKIARAIHHAHERGLVHRDIKPSNVIVAPSGDPVLLDFGLVLDEASEEETLSEDGALVGTPAYMSPEQLLGRRDQVDRRTDIWSLGVSFFECLCLQRPFAAATRQSLFHKITSVDPPSVESINRAIPRDLSVIVHVAMEKDTNRRYGTASSFAEDIQRFLNHEPIQARPAGVVLRLTRWMQRNMAVAGAVSLLFVVLVTALYQVNSERNQAEDSEQLAVERLVETQVAQRRAEEAEKDLSAALMRAENLLERAWDARDWAEDEKDLAVAVADFLNVDILSQVVPGEGGRNMTVLELFERAALLVDGRFQDHPTIEARLRQTLGKAFQRLGRLPEATTNLRRAFELNVTEYGASSVRAIVAENDLAVQLNEAGKYAEALKHFESALGKSRSLSGEDDSNTRVILSNLASLHRRLGRWELAQSIYEELLEKQTAILEPNHPTRVTTLSSLALACYTLKQFDRSVELNREALAHRVETLGDDHPSTLRSRNNLGMALWKQGDLSQASIMIAEVLRQREDILGKRHPSTLSSMNNLGILWLTNGQVDESVELLEKTLDLRLEVLGEQHGDTLTSRGNLASALKRCGQQDEALELYRENLKAARVLYGDDHPMVSRMEASIERILNHRDRLK